MLSGSHRKEKIVGLTAVSTGNVGFSCFSGEMGFFSPNRGCDCSASGSSLMLF